MIVADLQKARQILGLGERATLKEINSSAQGISQTPPPGYSQRL
jgi:hypothetical protein